MTRDPTGPGTRRSVGKLSGLVAAAALALGTGTVDAAGLLVSQDGFGGVLEVKEHSARVTISEGIAVTRVTQVFLNTEDRQVEALYTFPVPRGASVSGFSMWIGGKEMVGEVLAKERAREIYDSYKRVRRDPGLLEQVDYRTFEMRIFPIAPRAEQRVEVTYYQELDFDGDRATWVYPLATTARGVAEQRTTERFALAVEVKSEVPIVAVESPSHPNDIVVAKHSEGFCEASLEARGGDLGRDFVLTCQVSRPKTGIDLVTSKEKGEDGYFALTLTAGDELSGTAAGADHVFVIDVSGSMADDGKLDVSRRSVGAFVKALGAGDRFEVLTFNIRASNLFGRLSAPDEESVRRAEEFLGGQEARGGTVLRPAVEAAYRYAAPDRPLNVIILSDGMTEQEERAVLVDLIRKRPSGARVFCIGVGNDVNRPLLEQMADESGGLAAFLSRQDDLARQAQGLRRKLAHPAATDVSIEVDGADVRDLEPKRLPNLYHGTPVRLYGRYRKAGPAKVVVKAKVDGTDVRDELEVAMPEADSSHPEIERMWAVRRVDRLLKESDAEGTRARVVDEVVRLGELYSIVSEHTSFLVLENDDEFRRWKIERRNLLRLGRDRGSQEVLAKRLEELRQKAQAGLGPSPVPTATGTPGASTSGAAGSAPSIPSGSQPRPGSRDVSWWPGGGTSGGGALDPVSAVVAIGLAGLGLLGARARHGGRRGPRIGSDGASSV